MSNRKQGKKKARKDRKGGSKTANQAERPASSPTAPSRSAVSRPATDITHLLRIEAINIAAVCDDTDQISIRRGGSLLLRQAVIDAGGWLRELAKQDGLSEDQIKPVSIGGSIGIYGLRLEQRRIASVIAHIEAKLGQDPLYGLACFSVVACESDGTDYQDARERLLAQVRWQQLRQPNHYLPAAQAGCEGVCDFDHLSPGRRTSFLKREDCFLSEGVEQRFDYGRDQRNRFYESELVQCKDEWDLDVKGIQFTSDLHELSHNPRFGNLSDKIALIYFDGNGFSGYQQKYCHGIARQAQFDQRLRGARRAFLADLLQQAAADPDFKSQQAIRLEVLMWGGDEFLLVVPAWKGWEVAQHFLMHRATISIFEGTQKLTHAGGLVFCGAKTPIVRVRGLAQQLADWAKNQDAGRDRNSLAYLVLESIEYPTQGIQDYFADRFGVLATDQRPLVANQLDTDKLRDLLQLVPARLLHNLGRALVRHGPTGKEYQQQKDRAIDVLREAKFEQASDLLQQLFPNQKTESDWPWLHFLELRDYLAPQADPKITREDDQ